MRLRMRFVLPVIVLCTGLAAIPSLASSAGSSTATISGLESLMWSPMEVAITPGGKVTFENASTHVEHGIVWKSGPETPVCSGVPVNHGEYNWQGYCTFEKEGVYEFYCYIHGIHMSGKVFVNATGTIPTTTTTTTTSTYDSSTTMTMSTTSTLTTSTPLPYEESGKSPGGKTDSLKGGAVLLATSQHGAHVKGSVKVAVSDSTLTVEVFARLGSAKHRQLRVGKLVRSSLARGRAPFSVALNAKATHALHRGQRLPVNVHLSLTAPGGQRSTRTLPVVLHG